MKTFRCEFLGCKVNQYDAERARQYLFQHGFRESERRASFLLLASCTVTGTASRKGRQAVRSLLRQHPGAEVAVLGCLADTDRAFYESLDAAVTVLPSAREERFLDSLAPVVARVSPVKDVAPLPPRPRRTRMFLKVEDGCDLTCAFCIIPSVRGRARSRAPEDVEAELRGLVESGVPEIVLTGVHLGHYGRRSPWSLPGLLRRLLRVPGEWRLRLSSLEVSELEPALLDLFANEPRLVPHLHLPLQSGSNRILRLMRRPYTADRYREAVAEVQERLDRPAITSDVIVGFPGETQEDFEATLAVVRESRCSRTHVFPFSPRPGTEAHGMVEQVAPVVIKARKSILMALDRDLREESLQRMRGHQVRVVVEEHRDDGYLAGYDERYHRTHLTGFPDPTPGRTWNAEVQGVMDGALIARVLSGESSGFRTTTPDF